MQVVDHGARLRSADTQTHDTMASARTATITRKTNETEIEVFINLDCQPGSASVQTIDISTGIGFLDHVSPLPHEILAARLLSLPEPSLQLKFIQ
jgi:hypothetical protein